jgi:hypothetical protein
MTATHIKQPSESRVYAIDFRNLLAAGDTCKTVSSLAVSPAGVTLGTGAASGTFVRFRASGGTAGVTYQITAVVVTTNGDTLEGDGLLAVEQL